MADTPFNMNTSLDENLNDVPEDLDDMKLGIMRLLEQSQKVEDDVKKALILAKAGVFSRAAGNLDNSESLLTEAIGILKDNDMLKQATDLRVRLALTHVSQQKYSEAEKVFNSLIEKADEKQPRDEAFDKLKEICLMGLGKMKFDQKMYPGAKRCFSEAAEMKMNRGDTAGYNKCNESLEITQKKMDEITGANKTETAPDNYIDPLLAGTADDDLENDEN